MIRYLIYKSEHKGDNYNPNYFLQYIGPACEQNKIEDIHI